MSNHLDEMLDGYKACALWAGQDWSVVDDKEVHNPDPLDKNYSVEDITDEAEAAMRASIETFIANNSDDLDLYSEQRQFNAHEGTVWEYAGHDFFLNRNGHGTGFWDRGLGELGDRLSTAAKASGEQELYVGDDGKLYV